MIVKGNVVSIEIDVQVAKNGGGTYPGSRLTYRDETGTIKEKAFHQNVFKFNAPLKVQLANLKVGETFNMTMEKEGEFWNVKGIAPAGATPPVADKDVPATGKTTPYQAPKSTYATPEERAQTQVYIVRQSSINAAVALSAANKATYDVKTILDIAKQFEAHVMGEHFDDGTMKGMEDDVI
jgi:hypothetical protein